MFFPKSKQNWLKSKAKFWANLTDIEGIVKILGKIAINLGVYILCGFTVKSDLNKFLWNVLSFPLSGFEIERNPLSKSPSSSLSYYVILYCTKDVQIIYYYYNFN